MPPPTGLLEDARALCQEWARLAQDRLQLAALETKLAGESLVTMIAAGVIAAVLLVSAWLGLAAAAILALVGVGVSANIAILAAAAANLLGALLLYALIRRKSRHLRWAASIRSLESPVAAEHDPPSVVDAAR